MASKTWNLTARDFQNQQTFSGDAVGGNAGKLKVTLDRLSSGLAEGVDQITIENGRGQVILIPTRGMSVWKATFDGQELGWKSPVPGPVHPQYVPLHEPSGLGWLDGFDELLVRCGLASNGAPDFDEETGRLLYPLHGKIGNLPARDVTVTIDGDQGEAVVEGVVEEVRFHFLKVRLTARLRIGVDEAGFRIDDGVENLSASPAEVQILYHVNFGHPLLDGGSQAVAPVKELVPRNEHAAKDVAQWSQYQAESPGFEEQVYFATLRSGRDDKSEVLLKNAHGTQGASLQFSVAQLPCFTVWKNTTSVEDGYVTGLEPGTNYPNPRTFEGQQGRIKALAAGEKAEFGVRLISHGDAASVQQAEQRIDQLRGDAQPTIHTSPQDGWCA